MRASCTARAVSFRNLRANRGHLYFRLRWLHRLLDRQDRELTSSALAKDPSPRLHQGQVTTRMLKGVQALYGSQATLVEEVNVSAFQ